MFFLRNDIAIMKLSQPIQETASVAIAELPVDDQLLPHGLTCYVTGWGATDSENAVTCFSPFLDKKNPSASLLFLLMLFSTVWGNTAHILQEAPLSVVEHSICSQPEWWGSLARENMICAGGDGAVAACWVLLIIVSLCFCCVQFQISFLKGIIETNNNPKTWGLSSWVISYFQPSRVTLEVL